ncbi:hypothetical protein LCGC14_2397870 [marine sediment metagenome]|uniref:Uncharacterized protein n=1 Tax=marine sediment metagenome TaxID=412755 RepID=A0A0F9BW97_9ZZZZ
MAQFTPAQLARTLANVEREVLVEAIAIANLEQIFLTRTIETVDQLQFLFNAAQNIITFGPAWFKREARKEMAAFRKEHPIWALLFDLAVEFSESVEGVQDTSGTILELVRSLAEFTGEFDREAVKTAIDRIELHTRHLIEGTLSADLVDAEARRIQEQARLLVDLLDL